MSNEVETKPETNEKDLVVVINEGKEIEENTVKIEWRVSERVANEIPKYVFLFWQSEDDENNTSYCKKLGYRKLVEFDRGYAFLPNNKPGKYRLMLAVCENTDKRTLKNSLLKGLNRHESHNFYDSAIPWEETGLDSKRHYFLISRIKSFEIPEKVMAKKPKSGLSLILWKLINFWYDEGPKSNCAYFWRGIFSPVTIPLSFIVYLIVYLSRIISAGYVLVGSIILFLIGYRPFPIWQGICERFKGNHDSWLIRYYDINKGLYGNDQKRIFLLWSVEGRGDDKKFKYLPAPPICDSFPFLFLWALWIHKGVPTQLVHLGPSTALFNASIIFIWAVILFLLLFVFLRVKKSLFKKDEKYEEQKQEKKILARRKRLEKAEIAQKEREEKRKEWIKKQLTLNKGKGKIILNMPEPATLMGIVFQKLHIGFWTMKKDHCRLYKD